MDLDKPIRFNEPSYDWEPEHGSYGCEPRASRGFTKSATDNDGGNYPVQNDNTREASRSPDTNPNLCLEDLPETTCNRSTFPSFLFNSP